MVEWLQRIAKWSLAGGIVLGAGWLSSLFGNPQMLAAAAWGFCGGMEFKESWPLIKNHDMQKGDWINTAGAAGVGPGLGYLATALVL